MEHADRITFNPRQCGERTCIRGMRIRVKDVLDLLAARVPEAEILADYPDLQPEDIQASIEYVAAQLTPFWWCFPAQIISGECSDVGRR
jgi:uncharacterized protein (DUF433 family)